MKTKALLCLLTAALVGTPSAMAGGFYIDHFGARGAAMGNTYLGRVLDSTAVFHNPAALTLLEKSEVRADLRFAFVESEYEPAGDYPASEEGAGAQLSPFVGGATKFGNLAFGVGVYSPFGIALEYDKNWGRYQLTEIDLKTIYVNPSVAYPVTDALSLGMGISYVYSTVEQTLHMDPLGMGMVEYDAVAHLEVENTGALGGNVGVQYHQDKLYVGASYSYHPAIDHDGDVEMKLPPALGGVTLKDKVKSLELELCDTARFGVGYQVMDDLFLQAEVDWIGWGENDGYTVDFKDETAASDMEVEKDWDDTIGFRLGGEYVITDNVMVRAGYEYDKGAIPEETMDLSVPDGDKHMVSLGLGYHMDALQLDMAWLHFMIDETNVTYSVHDNPMLPYSSHQGEYSASLDWIHLTIGYLF